MLYSGRSITSAFAQGVTDNAGKAEDAVRDAMRRAQHAADGVKLGYETIVYETPIRGNSESIANAIAQALHETGMGTHIEQTFNYPSIAPSVLRINERLDVAAMPRW